MIQPLKLKSLNVFVVTIAGISYKRNGSFNSASIPEQEFEYLEQKKLKWEVELNDLEQKELGRELNEKELSIAYCCYVAKDFSSL